MSTHSSPTQLQNQRDQITSKIATYRSATVPVRWEDKVALEIIMGEMESLRLEASSVK